MCFYHFLTFSIIPIFFVTFFYISSALALSINVSFIYVRLLLLHCYALYAREKVIYENWTRLLGHTVKIYFDIFFFNLFSSVQYNTPGDKIQNMNT